MPGTNGIAPRPAWAGIVSPTQLRSIVQSTARINVWTGAIRSGKTISSLLRWLQYVANEALKSGELFIVGQTTRTIERNLITPLQDPDLFGELARHVHLTPGTDVAVLFGRTVALIGAIDVRRSSASVVPRAPARTWTS